MATAKRTPIEGLGDVRTLWNGREIQKKIKKATGKGLRAGAIFLVGRIKELISVPSKQLKIVGVTKAGKAKTRRELVAATPGAPARKLTGTLRRSITHEMSADGTTARVGTNVVYAPILEKPKSEGGSNHPFIQPTLDKWLPTVFRIIGQKVRVEIGK